MAALVWVTLGIAIWHFTVFVPDRFRWGIIGAFLGAVIGACASGAIFQILSGDGIGETSILTALSVIPGCLAGLTVMYQLGVRDEAEAEARLR